MKIYHIVSKPKFIFFFHLSSYLIHFLLNQSISLVGRVFTNGPRARGSIPVQVIPKTQKNGT